VVVTDCSGVEREYVSVNEAAVMLGGLDYDTVVRMFDDGRLSGYRTSYPRGKRMVSVASIRALAEPTVAPDDTTNDTEEG
jgi:hypothetical protein